MTEMIAMDFAAAARALTVNAIALLVVLTWLSELSSCSSTSFAVVKIGSDLHAWVTFRACFSASA